MTDRYSREDRSAIMARVRGANTGPELVVRRILHRLGYRFRLHRRDLPGRPDIVLPKHRTVVFVHGCFWHQHSCRRGRRKPASNLDYWLPKLTKNVQRDAKVKRALKRLGWRVLTIWECQLASPELRKHIDRFVRNGHDDQPTTPNP